MIAEDFEKSLRSIVVKPQAIGAPAIPLPKHAGIYSIEEAAKLAESLVKLGYFIEVRGVVLKDFIRLGNQKGFLSLKKALKEAFLLSVQKPTLYYHVFKDITKGFRVEPRQSEEVPGSLFSPPMDGIASDDAETLELLAKVTVEFLKEQEKAKQKG